jgi:beta-glucanase (GH16 family)
MFLQTLSSRAASALLFALALSCATHADTPASSAAPLFTPTAASIAAIKTEKEPVLSLEGSALKIAFPNGGDYPGLDLPLAGGIANLSAFAGIQAEITNVGPSRLNVNLRADNPGDWKKSPWNTNIVWIAPGETKTVKVTFGQSFGRPGYALDASRVSNIKLFTERPKIDAVVLVKNIVPFGTATPAAAPVVASASAPITAATASVPAGAVIFTPTADNIATIKTETDPVLAFDSSTGSPALKVTFPNGGDYPGFDFPLTGGQLNLSGFAGVQATLTNAGQSRLNVALRAGNPGDWQKSPWNTGNVWIAPGETKTLKVVFGQSYGHPGYALDASRVNVLKLYVEKPKADAVLLIKNLAPFGTASAPSVAASASEPDSAPVAAGVDATFSPSIGGDLLDLAKNQLAGFNYSDSSAVIEAGKIKVTFEAGSNYPNLQFPIPKGGWNLAAFGGIEVTVTNTNEKKVTLLMRADNPGDWKKEPWNTERLLFAPGETKTLKLTFGQQNGAPGFPLNPARISAIQVFIERPKTDTVLVLSNLKASGSPADAANKLSFTKPEDRNTPAVLPAWLGQRPPADLPGEWVKTLDENFDGTRLDDKLWTPRFPWDGPQPGQLQRYAPENVIVANGVASFKVEKRSGHENNDPKLGTRDYTSGLIQSYGKWTQLYGYFEARIKVPYVRGLWPAYWMMPDRGAATGLSQWARRDTAKGAMEIDIMEILSEWGPGRNSVATHWDGYGSDHKQWGTTQIYYGPTPDGYHVFGLLWEPGKLTWYVDGKKAAEQITDRVSNVPAYLKFNIQMGGWATKAIDDANLPATMDVDYTRAWQLKSRL